jgi:hypothetical protein
MVNYYKKIDPVSGVPWHGLIRAEKSGNFSGF